MAQDSSRSHSLSLILDAALALLGLSLSAYSLRHHLAFKASGATNAVCNVNDVISCDAAAASPYSEIAGIPLGVYGIAFFSSLLVFNVMRAAASRGGSLGHMAAQTHAVMVLIGVAVSIVLAIVSATSVQALCLVCAGIYLVNIMMAFSLHMGRAQLARPFSKRAVAIGGVIAFAITGISGWSYTQFVATRKPAKLNPQSAQSLTQSSAQQAAQPSSQGAARQIPLSRSAYSGAGEDYRYGYEQAKVVVQEFVDFQCPGCAVLASTIKELKAKYGSRVLFVFRNYPLDGKCNHNINGTFHAHACAIATMARCAGQYGKFWEYNELAFSKQSEASAENAVKWAKVTGLPQDAIETCQKSQDILSKLKDDVALADQLGVTGTPTLFINGVRYDGDRSLAALGDVLERALIEAQ